MVIDRLLVNGTQVEVGDLCQRALIDQLGLAPPLELLCSPYVQLIPNVILVEVPIQLNSTRHVANYVRYSNALYTYDQTCNMTILHCTPLVCIYVCIISHCIHGTNKGRQCI